LGTAGPLSLLKHKLIREFVLTNGDILTNLNFKALADWHRSQAFDLTVVTKAFQTPLSYGVIRCEGDQIVEITEKPVLESIINAGIYCIEPKCLEVIPENEPYGMNTFIRTLIQKGFSVGQYRMDSYWFDIGQFQDYERAMKLHEEGKLLISGQ
jgi:NDP-sugar pyrophosphorylase family protein